MKEGELDFGTQAQMRFEHRYRDPRLNLGAPNPELKYRQMRKDNATAVCDSR